MKTAPIRLRLRRLLLFACRSRPPLSYVLSQQNHAAPNAASQDPVVARGPEPSSQPLSSPRHRSGSRRACACATCNCRRSACRRSA